MDHFLFEGVRGPQVLEAARCTDMLVHAERRQASVEERLR